MAAPENIFSMQSVCAQHKTYYDFFTAQGLSLHASRIHVRTANRQHHPSLIQCKQGPPACLAVRMLTTRQKVPDPNLDSGMKVCSGSDSILNRGVGVFRPHVQKMNIGPTTNQITDVNETLFFMEGGVLWRRRHLAWIVYNEFLAESNWTNLLLEAIVFVYCSEVPGSILATVLLILKVHYASWKANDNHDINSEEYPLRKGKQSTIWHLIQRMDLSEVILIKCTDRRRRVVQFF